MEETKSIKEHIGFVVSGGPFSSMNSATAIKKIVAAEAAGIRQIWIYKDI
jgi:hypothetical protein